MCVAHAARRGIVEEWRNWWMQRWRWRRGGSGDGGSNEVMGMSGDKVIQCLRRREHMRSEVPVLQWWLNVQ